MAHDGRAATQLMNSRVVTRPSVALERHGYGKIVVWPIESVNGEIPARVGRQRTLLRAIQRDAGAGGVRKERDAFASDGRARYQSQASQLGREGEQPTPVGFLDN